MEGRGDVPSRPGQRRGGPQKAAAPEALRGPGGRRAGKCGGAFIPPAQRVLQGPAGGARRRGVTDTREDAMLQLGFDAARVSRLEKSMGNPRFCERVFSAQENALIAAKPRPAETAAAHFAAKEALGKALRCGIFGFDLRQAARRVALFCVQRRAGGADGTAGPGGGGLALPRGGLRLCLRAAAAQGVRTWPGGGRAGPRGRKNAGRRPGAGFSVGGGLLGKR